MSLKLKTLWVAKYKTWFFAFAILSAIIGEALVLFATPLLVLEYTGKASLAGLAFAIEWLPAVLIYPFAGVLADRIGGRRLFIISSWSRVVFLALCIAGIYFIDSWLVAILMVNSALMSLFSAPNRMAVEKMVPLLAEGKSLPIIQSVVQNSELIAWTLGPALAATLVLYVDNFFILGLSGFFFFCSAIPIIVLTQLAHKKVKENLGDQNIGKEMLQGFKLLFSSQALMLLAILNCTINLAFAVTLASHAAIITGTFGLEDSAYGILNSVTGFLGIINLLLVPLLLKKINIYSLGIFGLTFIVLGLVATSLVDSYIPYLLGFVVASMGVAMFNVFNRTQRIKAISQQHIGKIMGPFYVLNLVTLPVGGFIVTFFADQHGNQILIGLVTVLLAIIGPLLIMRTQRAFEHVFKTQSKIGEVA